MISKVEQLKRRRYNQKNHKTLEEGVKRKKNHRQFKTRKGVDYFNDRSSGNKTTN